MTSAEQRNGSNWERLGTATGANVGTIERWLSVAGGVPLVACGLWRRGIGGTALALLGGGLIYRGATGRSPLYRLLGVNTAESHAGAAAVIRHGQGVKIERAVTINRPRDELFRAWRDLAHLPRFMDHLESVEVRDGGTSHWIAKGPAGRQAEWDAEIFNEQENELIAWKSVEGSAIANAGSVRFAPAPDGRGTEVQVMLEYEPPAGPLGAAVAAAFGENPAQQVREDLRRFKQIMEAGEPATTAGQPSGRRWMSS